MKNESSPENIKVGGGKGKIELECAMQMHEFLIVNEILIYVNIY